MIFRFLTYEDQLCRKILIIVLRAMII